MEIADKHLLLKPDLIAHYELHTYGVPLTGRDAIHIDERDP